MTNIAERVNRSLTEIGFSVGHANPVQPECYVEYVLLAQEARRAEANFSQLGIMTATQAGPDAIKMVSRKVGIGFQYIVAEDERLTKKYVK